MNVRIQFDLPEDKVKELEGLMEEANISTRKDLFNNALTLFEWAVKERKANRIISSMDEVNHRYKELIMPSLSAITPESTMASNPAKSKPIEKVKGA